MRVDIERLHREDVGLSGPVRRSAALRGPASLRLAFDVLAQSKNWLEPLVTTGFRRAWFDDFFPYWREVLGGRPISILEYFMLVHDYRKRTQYAKPLEWDSAEQHTQNWQRQEQIYSLLHYVRKEALKPFIGRRLWKYVRTGSRILEYGCSMAPYFSACQRYFPGKQCRWVLADLPAFPFHYARWRARSFPGVEACQVIWPERFKDPLQGIEGQFDVIIVTTVFEHLDDPLFSAQYLTERLRKGGLFVFDFLKNDGAGLDTPQSVQGRPATLAYLQDAYNIVEGRIEVDRDTGFCIGQKK